MGDAVRILKIDTDKNPDISTQLQAGAEVGLAGVIMSWRLLGISAGCGVELAADTC